MSKQQSAPNMNYSSGFDQFQSNLKSIQTKNQTITKFDTNKNYLQIGDSLVLGKNQILQTNTEQQINSEAEESDVSFEERLNLQHQQYMEQCINTYCNSKLDTNLKRQLGQSFTGKIYQPIKDIEEKTFQEIEKKYGNYQAQKVKFTIKYFKRKEELAKIYFKVIKNVHFSWRIVCYFLFKQSLIFYVRGRQQIIKQQSSVNLQRIEKYVNANYKRLCQQIQKDEKFFQMHYPSHDEKSRYEFQEFIQKWIECFFLCKEGYPNRKLQKRKGIKGQKIKSLQKLQGSQKRKKIKKW